VSGFEKLEAAVLHERNVAAGNTAELLGKSTYASVPS
jgi:hypothetical protein